ncbi:MAG TPA: hypothetical protein VEA79_08245, partial [Phenylobacterium sp.]|nr:hypothetical protein [Phenylobacterium sp.]
MTGNVTRAVLAKSAAMRIAGGLYNMLGGAVGVATLAIGALVYAVWRAEEAYRAEVQAQRDSLVVTDQLRALTDQATASTWGQIPALQAQAAALRASAQEALGAAEAQLALATARRSAMNARADSGQLPTESQIGASLFEAFGNRRIKDLEANVAAGRAAKFADDQEAARLGLVSKVVEARSIQAGLNSGRNARGDILSTSERAAMQARLGALRTEGQQQVDRYDREMREQQAGIAGATGVQKRQFTNGLALYGKNFDAAAELVTATNPAAAPPSTVPKKTGGGRKPSSAVPGPVNTALNELLSQEYFSKAGGERFSLTGGEIVDGATGGKFSARGPDEGKAAAAYVRQIEAINAATDKQIAKTGQSRQALRESASAALAYAVTNSKAAQADEKWADIQAEMSGQTRAVIKAEREVQGLIEAGTPITEAAAKAYVDFVASREKAKEMRAAMAIAEPAARAAFDSVTAGMVVPTDSRGVVDARAAAEQIAAVRERVLAESEKRILAEIARTSEAEGWTREEEASRTADAIAANRLAVEAVLQEQLLDLDRERLRQQSDYAEQQYAQAADAIIGPLRDAVNGGSFRDIGRDLIDGLLQAAYDELIFSPLRKAIIDVLRATFGGGMASSGTGLFSQIFGSGLGGMFGGSAGGAAGASSGLNPIAVDDLPGYLQKVVQFVKFADGGKVTGPGGPTSDSILAWVSNGEFVVRARQAQRHERLLQAINSGEIDRYASGGRIGGGSPIVTQPSGGPGETRIEFHNHTGRPMRAEQSEGPGGVQRINLYEQAGRGMIKQAGASGDLMRGLKGS